MNSKPLPTEIFRFNFSFLFKKIWPIKSMGHICILGCKTLLGTITNKITFNVLQKVHYWPLNELFRLWQPRRCSLLDFLLPNHLNF